VNGYLQIVLVDDSANEFVTLGGAVFDTMAETRAQFRRIPAVAESDIILDLVRDNATGPTWGVVDDKHITREVAEALLGEDIASLTKKARALLAKP